MMRIGLLKETKNPPDRRVPLTPWQAAELQKKNPGTEVVVESSSNRCFSDEEFSRQGVRVVPSPGACDVIMGVKEVAIPALIAGRTYVFFSHTGKKQPYNRDMLREIIRKNITLVDYEYLTTPDGNRLVAFGRWAGIVGAYNGLRGWGLRHGSFRLKPARECFNLKELLEQVRQLSLPPIRILITGGGRVAHGAMETLMPLNIKKVTPAEYLSGTFDRPVFCQLDPGDYVRRRDGQPFSMQDFMEHPDRYESAFLPYALKTDLYIPCHYWDPRSPVFLRPEDYLHPGFPVRVIADVSCDIGKPVASTLRASTIEEPFYGYHPHTGKEGPAFDKDHITVMAVDNLPGELPRDASEDFGNSLLKHFFPALLTGDQEGMIRRATIVKEGKLTERFEYLRDYVEG
ncbi:MAG TPA: alanine dehydrogenase [Bacteroidetes bacterium]|nr:alanine dehydrogenase [Bacteroidota bacterium]